MSLAITLEPLMSAAREQEEGKTYVVVVKIPPPPIPASYNRVVSDQTQRVVDTHESCGNEEIHAG